MNLPLVDLQRQRHSIADELQPVIDAVLDHCHFGGGPEVGQFEEAFASLCGVEHCVGVGNGTDAVFLARLALGVGPGDEVITAANSFVATAEAITMPGATPVFVDIEEDCFTIDVSLIAAAVTAVMQLLYFAARAGLLGGRDDD